MFHLFHSWSNPPFLVVLDGRRGKCREKEELWERKKAPLFLRDMGPKLVACTIPTNMNTQALARSEVIVPRTWLTISSCDMSFVLIKKEQNVGEWIVERPGLILGMLTWLVGMDIIFRNEGRNVGLRVCCPAHSSPKLDFKTWNGLSQLPKAKGRQRTFLSSLLALSRTLFFLVDGSWSQEIWLEFWWKIGN